jgi:hypothetical protein
MKNDITGDARYVLYTIGTFEAVVLAIAGVLAWVF